MALKKVKGNLERLFDKSLTDLVRGIRNNRDNEAKYIAACLDEIKAELKQDNIAVKTNAIEKLIYLQMLGYDISWAAFNIIEVMSSAKFTCKRVGYLAASQSFCEETDVLMLTTNMIRKDITSPNLYDASIALGGLSCFISMDLARDLSNDAMSLMTSSKPYIRKRAVLLMYKVFLKYPDALRPCFQRLREKLEDPDPGVQSAAVNVICELARKHPKNYLALAPTFFKLMTNSTNNWMLIKIIKLFGALVPLEPRLGKKLIEPLTTLIHSTSAMSLLYECINTVIAVLLSVASGLPDHTASIQLCVQKLRILIEDSDQNLKYLGLSAMSKILQAHPKSVLSLKDLILQCLDDRDESIRVRALDLLYGMVNKKTLIDIVKKLMDHMRRAEGSVYRDELLTKIIHICSQNNYQYVVDFEWYVSVLVDLTKIEGLHHGDLLASQLLDVAVRVPSVRHFTVQQMAVLLENVHRLPLGGHGSTNHEVLFAAAWVCGEFSDHLIDPRNTMESLLKSKVLGYPSHIQAVYVQNVGKLYAKVVSKIEPDEEMETITALNNILLERLPLFAGTSEIEVQERASALLQVVRLCSELLENGEKVAPLLDLLYCGELNPVAPQAQRKVPVPEGLDLDAWINEPLPDKAAESSEEEDAFIRSPRRDIFKKVGTRGKRVKAFDNEAPERNSPVAAELTAEELEERKQRRLQEEASNPYYLKQSRKPSKVSSTAQSSPSVTSPVDNLGLLSSETYLQDKKKTETKASKKSKKAKKEESDEDRGHVEHSVNRDRGEMPEGASWSDEHDNDDDQYKALDIDLTTVIAETRKPSIPNAKKEQPVVMKTTEKSTKKKSDKKSEKDGSKKKKSKSSTDAEKEPEKKIKKKKAAEKENRTAEEDLLNIETDNKDTSVISKIETASPVVEPKSSVADLDFWLTQPAESKQETDRPKSLGITKMGKSTEKEGKPKDEKKKKSRSKLRSHSTEEALVDEAPREVDRTGYEEAFGTTQELVSQSGSPQAELPTSHLSLLTEDKNLRIEYDSYVSDSRAQQITVNLVLSNKCEDATLRNINFEVVDSVGLAVDKNAGMDMPIQFSQLLGKSSWNLTLVLKLSAASVSPQTIRGSVTYVKGATSEMKDFKLVLPCSAFMLPVQISPNEFLLLMESGQMSATSGKRVELSKKLRFSDVLSMLCVRGRFYLVEQAENSATLHSMTVMQERLVMLVKFSSESAGSRITLDAKSNDQALTSYCVEEMAGVLERF